MKNIDVFTRYAISTVATVLSGVIFALCGDRLPHVSGSFSSGVVCWACLVSAVTDVKTRKIYNVVTYPAFAALLVAQLVGVAAPSASAAIGPSAGSAFLGFVMCFVAVLLPFALGAGGAGDAKLAAVVGLGLGALDGVFAVGAAFVLAAPYVLSVFAIQTVAARSRKSKSNESQPDGDKPEPRIMAPMGPTFLLGTFAATTGVCARLLDFTI